MKFLTVNKILWLVYLSLLAVLLPHTAYTMMQFEPDALLGRGSAWGLAFAFEASIAALTHKLSKQIESTPRRAKWLAKFSHRYLNFYLIGLVASVGVSSLANLAHAVEFGRTMKIFTEWGIPFAVYAIAFGAILPMISLVFARVLSNVVETELEDDPALIAAKEQLAELRRKMRDTEHELTLANIARTQAEQRFAAIGDLFVRLMSDEKREKILAASQLWPELPGKAIAIIADSTPSYVSEVLAVTK